MAKEQAYQFKLALEDWQKVETYYGERIDDMSAEEARAALRHCIQTIREERRDYDALLDSWIRFGFPKQIRLTPKTPARGGKGAITPSQQPAPK